jgi:hypothetical protein
VVAEDGVALTTQTYAEQLGKVYAEAVRDEPKIEEIWISTVPGCVHLWLITPLLDMEERQLLGYTRVLYDTFKKADFMVHVLNPRHFQGSTRAVVPSYAVQVPLRRS